MNIEEYEKEKEIVDKINKLNIPVDTLIAEFERLENLEDDRDMLKSELEKEKEKNKELSNSYDELAKECNEENRRCMLLAVENQDLKEKNKKDKIKAKIEEWKKEAQIRINVIHNDVLDKKTLEKARIELDVIQEIINDLQSLLEEE